jgi:uncharacterized protein (DUF952 family)
MTALTAATRILHFATPADWQAAQGRGEYVPASYAAEGFIHCATPAQVAGVVARHLRGRGPRLRLLLDPTAFGEALCYEWSEASNDLYPHLYCAIPLDRVLAVTRFDPDA